MTRKPRARLGGVGVTSRAGCFLFFLLAAIAAGCVGQVGETSGGGADGGIATADPFSTPPRCTSGVHWTNGNEGSEVMNPGRACIDCHTQMGEGPRFAIAGTVYPTAHEPDLCNGSNGSGDARVTIVGADGQSFVLTPNEAGNFFSDSRVALPYQAKLTYMGRERAMASKQTSGDCNACHTQAGVSPAPGRILLP